MRRAAAGLVLIITVGLALSGCSSTPTPDSTARAYLSNWANGDITAAAQQTDDATTAAAELTAAKKTLGTDPQLTFTSASSTDTTGTARFHASWPIPGSAAAWTYDGSLSMQRKDNTWSVHWESADLAPKLADGARLSLSRTLPNRAELLDRTGRPLTTTTQTVTVGIQPSKVKSLSSLAATLASVLDVSAAQITSDVKKAKPDEFVPVITLRRSAYEVVKPKIYDLSGTVFQTGSQSLGPTAAFAQPLLGRVGEATADALKAAGNNYRAGDSIGISGLQEALNSSLAGTATTTITSTLTAGGTTDRTTLATITGRAGRNVKLTLSRSVQQAADSTLANISAPAAIVAVQASTGQILAAANSPGAPFDIAMAGQYPPGSTWKIVTAASALQHKVVQKDSTVACPGSVNLGGRVVPNENGFDLGTVSMTTAFAQSCNTVFAPLSVKLPDGALARTAAQFGVGQAWQLPVTSFSGSLPADATSVAERAAEGYGQGQDLVSPFAEALMAATIAHGSVPSPSLVVGKVATPKASPVALSSVVRGALKQYARAVVTEGTATNLNNVAGGPVYGKTGTAEYGGSPPKAHSWFTGYQGDVAFSVFVYGGQSDGQLANPLAQNFLADIN